ncbi:MAG: M24 family metallopeptidase [Candidatus ainarchaeum sp.]|nr:M24 family metallopeptidase [Candidatus ainarchaeum sp.]
MFNKVDSVIMINYHNYWKNPFVNKYLENNISDKFEGMLILKEKEIIWLSHPFNYQQIKKDFAKISKINGKKLTIINANSKKIIDENLIKFTGKKIGFHFRYTTVSQLKNLKKLLKGKKFIDVSIDLEKEREIKTENEIKNISIAVKKTQKIIDEIKDKKLCEKQSEKEIEEYVKKRFNQEKMETAFCIIALGKNTTNIHHVNCENKISSGPVLIDIGGKYKGYCSDLSESFWIGKKDEKYTAWKKRHYLIHQKIKEIETKLKNGTSVKELWNLVKDLEMNHCVGHGIGIEEHDAPSGIGPKSDFLLKENMVLAIEIGLYKDFGIRIENDYLITKKGFKKLN